MFGRWEDAVGATIAANARPVRLEQGILLVEVDEPAWATQVRFLADDVCRRLAEVAGVAVERIEVRSRPGGAGDAAEVATSGSRGPRPLTAPWPHPSVLVRGRRPARTKHSGATTQRHHSGRAPGSPVSARPRVPDSTVDTPPAWLRDAVTPPCSRLDSTGRADRRPQHHRASPLRRPVVASGADVDPGPFRDPSEGAPGRWWTISPSGRRSRPTMTPLRDSRMMGRAHRA